MLMSVGSVGAVGTHVAAVPGAGELPQQKEAGGGMHGLGNYGTNRAFGGGYCWVHWQDSLMEIQSTLKDTYFYSKWRDWTRWLSGLFHPEYAALS